MIKAGVLIGSLVLGQAVDINTRIETVSLDAAVALDNDSRCIDILHNTWTLGNDNRAGVACDNCFHTGTDKRGVRSQQRNSLTLHVGTHEGAVASSCSRKGISPAATLTSWFGETSIRSTSVGTTATKSPPLRDETSASRKFTLRVDRCVGLRDNVFFFFNGRQIANLVGHPSVFHHPVRGLDETELIDAGIGAERNDQTDIRTFRCLDRTDTSVMRGMNVAHLETGALTRQPAGPQRRQTSLVSYFRQRIRLGP